MRRAQVLGPPRELSWTASSSIETETGVAQSGGSISPSFMQSAPG
jgi:hypothetical protein